MIIGVIGANGFVGRSLCNKFIAELHDVFAFYHVNKSSIPSGCKIFSIDDIPDVNFDYLYISIGSHGLTHQDYLDQYSFLEKILKNIIFTNVIFISSVEVFGKNTRVINSESCYNQPSLYGLSKISQEFLIKSCKNFLIIRPTYIYGPGMNNNSLIPIWSKNAVEKKEILIFGDGKREQDYLFIDDLVELCFLVTNYEVMGNSIIAATGNSVSNYDLAKLIAGNIPNTAIKFVGQDNSSSVKFDISETVQIYNWTPKTDVKEGILKLLKK